VTTVKGRYINGEIDQQTFSLPLRIDYMLTPNLSLQYWGQPFTSKGTYSRFKAITNPTASRFEDRFATFSNEQIRLVDGSYQVHESKDGVIDFTFGQPDFALVQWRSNLVLRWEYTPGSELFLVWSQDLSQFGDISNGLIDGLRTTIADTKPQNIFLIKATYRFMR